MSRLTDLLRRVEQVNPALAKELASEVKALASRREFGLNFERHIPESVELPGRRIRRGDKVRFRAPRGESDKELDERIWVVTGIEGRGDKRTAQLTELGPKEAPVTAQRLTEDLVAVAEFRDPIYPGLRSTGKVERGGDKPYHMVINGENYHALEALLFAYEGKVDCIYIDPPYNTRDKDWKYNNDYVDSDDAYRHSKWLAMMERRLKLAKRLLNPANSVLMVTIDEKEYLRLGLLLEQVFASCKVQMVTVVTNQRGVARGQEFARVDEYVYVVFIGNASVSQTYDDFLTTEETLSKQRVDIWNRLMRRGTDSQREDSPNQFYPIFVDPTRRAIVGVGVPLPLSQDRNSVISSEGLIAVWPIRIDGSEGRWTLGAKTLARYAEEGKAKVGAFNKTRGTWSISYLIAKDIKRIESGEIKVLGQDENGVLLLELDSEVRRKKLPRTVWHRDAHNAGTYGSALLGTLLPGRKFPFPKSLFAVEDMLRVAVGTNANAIVVDFFCGSGTTSQAVMRLNKQDGGHRQSVMVTNNEVSDEEARRLASQGLRPGDPEWEQLGICEYITKPRIRAAITGMTPEGESIKGEYKFTDEFPMADGFEENAEFFDLTYEDPERVRHDLAFKAIAPLLWMKAGSEGRRIDEPSYTYEIADTYGILFNLDAAAGFVQAVAVCERLRVAYIVTDDEKQYQAVAKELPGRVETVRLYEAYLRTFQVSGGED